MLYYVGVFKKGQLKMKEKQFESKVKRYLESKGIYRLGTDVRGKNAVGYYTKRHGNVFTGSGLPDMQIVVRGLCCEIELKNETGETSPMQDFIIDQINNSHGVALVVRPQHFDEFKNFMERFV